MEVVIKGKPKEVAALVLEIQGRHGKDETSSQVNAPSIYVRAGDGCSDDVIRENIEVGISKIASRHFQDGVL